MILRSPIITEKSMGLASLGWYTFEVDKRATKRQIASAVASHFKVNVVSVKTITNKGKTKRVGKKRVEIVETDTKKALVKLKKDQKIALFENSGAQQ